jgi:hypothetical protein
MAFDVSGLTAYIEEQNFPLITKAVTGGRTASLMEKQVGVKGKTKINLMDVDVNFQDGSGCAFNANGDVTFTQREIDPAKLKLNMEFCPKTLEGLLPTFATSKRSALRVYSFRGAVRCLLG